jgi:hypothetical protein
MSTYRERRERDLAAQRDGRLCACEGPHVSGCTVAFAHVVYFADPLPGDRAQMRADVIEDGRVVKTYPVGSPAPRKTVEAAARRDNR